MPVPPAAPLSPDWQLRVRTLDGGTAGAGVLVSPRHLLTCAHVVCAALGVFWEEEATPRPEEPVLLDAPRGGGTWQARATVLEDGWFVDRSPWDAAVLLLDRPAPAAPPEIRRCGPVDRPGRTVSMVGFTHDTAPAGVWSRATLVGQGGGRRFEYVQLDLESSTAARVVYGFSGSGVREDPGGALIGIVCQADHDETGLGVRGWMIPVEAVPDVWGRRAAPLSGASRRDPGPRAVHGLAVAVARTSTIAEPEARRAFYALLDARFRQRLNADAAPLFFADRLVRLALEHEQLEEVLETLEMLEEGSLSMRRVREAAEALWGQ